MKIVMGSYYVHISNIKELLNELKMSEQMKVLACVNMHDIDVAVVKYDTKSGNVSVIESPDWDKVHEPTVGKSVCYKYTKQGKYKGKSIRRGGTQVYHNKWQFVAPDYEGFDIEEEKKRSEIWNKIPNIDKKRIGNKKYWYNLLKENNLEL